MPSTSRGPNLELPNSMRPIRRPPPRMAAFAVPSTSRNPDEQPSAKRRQIETRQKQLDSLKKIENRYKNLQRCVQTKPNPQGCQRAMPHRPHPFGFHRRQHF